MTRIRRIVFATDLSTASSRAFTVAIAMTTSLKARLTIVNVMAPILQTVPEQYVDPITFDRLERQEREWSSQQLKKLADRAGKRGITATIQLLRGNAAEQIVAAAKAQRADLIVVGTHGRQGLPRFFLGSVAQRVVTLSHCPVVTVREQ